MAYFKANLFSAHSLAGECYSNWAYDIFETSGYCPEVFDVSEPILQSWNAKDAFCEAWRQQSSRPFGQILLQRKQAIPFYASVVFQFGPDRKRDGKPPYHGLSLYDVDESKCIGESRKNLIDLCDRLFAELEFDYGFLCLHDEYDAKNIIKGVSRSGGAIEPRKVVGMNWPYCLPGLYWTNYFGGRYFDQGFGEGIQALHSTEIARVGKGVRLQTSHDPRFFQSDRAEQIERGIRDKLGSSWFFDRESDHDCNALEVSLDELRSP